MEPGYFDSLCLDDDFGTRRWLTTQREAWRLISGGEYEFETPGTISLQCNLRRLLDWDNPSSGLLGFVVRTDLSFNAWSSERDAEQIVALVRSALESGRLVVVRESGDSAGDPSAEFRAEARRLVREIERLTEGDLRSGGRRYTLCVRDQVDRSALGETRRMMPPREATTILEAMASESGGGELAALLTEAKAFFSGISADACELALLRHLVQQQARMEQAPVTPSQLKAENASWIEIEVVDERGEPWPRRLHIVLADGSVRDVKTDDAGFVRLEAIAPGITETTAVRDVAPLSATSQAPTSQVPQKRDLPSELPSPASPPKSLHMPTLADLPKIAKVAGALRALPSAADDLAKLAHGPSLADVVNLSKSAVAINTGLDAAGLPSVPALPQRPTLPNVPSVPSVRDLASVAGAAAALNTALNAAGLPLLPALPQIPSLPKLPSLPNVPRIPSAQDLANVAKAALVLNTALSKAGLPSLPALPQIPSLPNVPTVPELPHVPSLQDLAVAAQVATVINTGLGAMGLPNFPILPNAPSLPHLPSQPNVQDLAGMSKVPGVQSVAGAAVVAGRAVDSLAAAAGIVDGGGSSSPPQGTHPPSAPASAVEPKKK